MRMRRKRNLDGRMDACEGWLLPYRVGADEKDSTQPGDGSHMIDLRELFGNDAPVELELGCGKGRFVCEMARRRPDVNFLAVEMLENVVVAAAETARDEALRNVRFLALGAEYLGRYLPAGSISRIYLNFSCPYPKQRTVNRRLTAPRFLALYSQLMAEGAQVVQKTDNRKFFEYSITSFSSCGWVIDEISLDLHADDCPDNIATEYEDKFSALGPIYRLAAHPADRRENVTHASEGEADK